MNFALFLLLTIVMLLMLAIVVAVMIHSHNATATAMANQITSLETHLKLHVQSATSAVQTFAANEAQYVRQRLQTHAKVLSDLQNAVDDVVKPVAATVGTLVPQGLAKAEQDMPASLVGLIGQKRPDGSIITEMPGQTTQPAGPPAVTVTLAPANG